MNWFPGTIAEAVNVSKTKNAIFVVYSEGIEVEHVMFILNVLFLVCRHSPGGRLKTTYPY